jgi:hypothetical protein
MTTTGRFVANLNAFCGVVAGALLANDPVLLATALVSLAILVGGAMLIKVK